MITENKMTFLTLPALPDAFALHGGGFKVSGLAAIPWLRECPIIYWGNLDAQGFQFSHSCVRYFRMSFRS